MQSLEANLARHTPQIVQDKAIRVDIGKREGQHRFNVKFQKTK